MPSPISQEILRSAIATRSTLERLRLQVDKVKKISVPGNHPGPKRWLAVIDGLIDTAEDYLDNLRRSDFISEFGGGPIGVVREAAALIRRAYYEINEMAGFSSDDIPYPVVAPLQRWFDSLGIKKTIIFRAKQEDNYEIRPYLKKRIEGIRKKSKSLEDAIQAIDWEIIRVTIPSKAFSYLPHFAIVAHEIGHAIYHRIAWDLSGLEKQKTHVEAALAKRGAPADDDVRKLIKEISTNWHVEFAADAVSYFLAGPAAFFALSDSMAYMGNTLGLSTRYRSPSEPLSRMPSRYVSANSLVCCR